MAATVGQAVKWLASFDPGKVLSGFKSLHEQSLNHINAISKGLAAPNSAIERLVSTVGKASRSVEIEQSRLFKSLLQYKQPVVALGVDLVTRLSEIAKAARESGVDLKNIGEHINSIIQSQDKINIRMTLEELSPDDFAGLVLIGKDAGILASSEFSEAFSEAVASNPQLISKLAETISQGSSMGVEAFRDMWIRNIEDASKTSMDKAQSVAKAFADTVQTFVAEAPEKVEVQATGIDRIINQFAKLSTSVRHALGPLLTVFAPLYLVGRALQPIAGILQNVLMPAFVGVQDELAKFAFSLVPYISQVRVQLQDFVAKTLIPIFSKARDILASLFGWINKTVGWQNFFKVVLYGVGVFYAYKAAMFVTNIAMGVYAAITFVATSATTLFRLALVGVKVALNGLGIGLVVSAIVMLVYGIGKLVAHLNGSSSAFEGLKIVLKSIGAAIVDLAKMVWGVLGPVFSSIGQIAVAAFKYIVDAVRPFAIWLGQIFMQAVQKVRPVFEWVFEFVQKQLTTLSPFIDSVGKAIWSLLRYLGQAYVRLADTFSPLLQGVATFFKGVWDVVFPIMRILVSVLKPAWLGLFFAIKVSAVIVIGALKLIWAIAQPILQKLFVLFGGIAKVIGYGLAALFYVLGSVFSVLGKAISYVADKVSWFFGYASKAIHFLIGLVDKLSHAFFGSGLWSAIGKVWEIFTGFVKFIKDGVNVAISIVNKLISYWMRVGQVMRDVAASVWNFAVKQVVATRDFAASVVDTISKAYSLVWDKLKLTYNKAIAAIVWPFRKAREFVLSIWKSLWDNLSSMLLKFREKALQWVPSWMLKIADKVLGTNASASVQATESIASSIPIAPVSNAVNNNISTVTNTVVPIPPPTKRVLSTPKSSDDRKMLNALGQVGDKADSTRVVSSIQQLNQTNARLVQSSTRRASHETTDISDEFMLSVAF